MLRRDRNVMGLVRFWIISIWFESCFTLFPYATTFINAIQPLPHPGVVSQCDDIKPLTAPSRNTKHSTIVSPILKIIGHTPDIIYWGIIPIQSQNKSFIFYGVGMPHWRWCQHSIIACVVVAVCKGELALSFPFQAKHAELATGWRNINGVSKKCSSRKIRPID